jgi:hypothetical protein
MGHYLESNCLLTQIISQKMKRLLLVESGLLIGGVILDMLKCHCTDLEVRTLPHKNLSEIDRIMMGFLPDIVMLDDTVPSEVLIPILVLSMQYPDLKIVMICSDSNRVQVFNTQRVEVENVEDFLAVF